MWIEVRDMFIFTQVYVETSSKSKMKCPYVSIVYLALYTYLLSIFLSFFVSYYDKARLPRTINALGNNRLYIE